MSEVSGIHVNFAEMDRESFLKSADALLASADFLVRLTPTTLDDQAVAFLKMLRGQEWAIDFVFWVKDLIDKKVNPEDIAAALADFKAKFEG